MKRVDQQTGQPVAVKERPQREEGEEHHHRERGDRDRDRGDRDGGRRRSRG
jgi:hypothetical protein